MYKLYIGYQTAPQQGWSASVAGFFNLTAALVWASRKLYAENNKKKLQHFWYWVIDPTKGLVHTSKHSASDWDNYRLKNITIDERHLTIKESNKQEEKISLFPKLVEWSPIEGLKAFETFANKAQTLWRKLNLFKSSE